MPVKRDNRLLVPQLERASRHLLSTGAASVETSSDGKFKRKIIIRAPDTKYPCTNPVGFETFARRPGVRGQKAAPISIIGKGRCRKCENCLMAKSIQWQLRAIAEYKKWPITVFGTFTMSLNQHYLLDASIMAGRTEKGRVVRAPQRMEDLSHEEIFSLRARVFGEHLQDYLKRLRKQTGKDALRYLLVAEAHDGPRTNPELRGRPHFHILLHSMTIGAVFKGNPLQAGHSDDPASDWIRRRYQSSGKWYEGVFLKDGSSVRKQWKLGWTKFQYAENEKMAAYLCKYLNKTSDALVRASLGYGK